MGPIIGKAVSNAGRVVGVLGGGYFVLAEVAGYKLRGDDEGPYRRP
jgi:hypothetical protein